jgi:hypothetical protein
MAEAEMEPADAVEGIANNTTSSSETRRLDVFMRSLER